MSDELLIADSAGAPISPLVPQIEWYYVAALVALHALAALALVPWFFSWTGVLLVPLGFYVFATLGSCIGFHRLLTHRSFSCPRWLERTLVLLGTCNLMLSPPYWVAVHRLHHHHADGERDPHSPARSFFWSHFGWYVMKVEPAQRAELIARYANDVMRDALYRFLERNHNWAIIAALSWLAFFAAGLIVALATGASLAQAMQFGASMLVWGGFVRTVYVMQVTNCVNSITHLWGYRNYATRDNSTNNVVMGVLATGEGWHNNHHADPASARHGHLWWELDIAWLTIRLMQRVGLVWKVVLPSPTRASVRPSD